MSRAQSIRSGRGLLGGAAVTIALCACGGSAVPPSAAVGKVGGSLSGHAQGVPQGAELCALEEAIQAKPGRGKTSVTEPCQDKVKSDELWGRSMTTLAAYGHHLEAVAEGTEPELSGQLQAALTGVRGPNWIDVAEDDEKAARNAVAELVKQLEKSNSDQGLEDLVKAAAPHVKKICDGLAPYLDKQAQSAATLRAELPNKEKAPTSRRCAMLDNRPICMADNVVDHMVYASAFGGLASMEASHRNAHNTVAAFCAAHAKLEKAAAAGSLDDEETGRAVIDEVKRAIPERSAPSGADGGEEAPPAAAAKP